MALELGLGAGVSFLKLEEFQGDALRGEGSSLGAGAVLLPGG